MARLNAANNAQTRVVGDITAATTSFYVVNASVFPATPFLISIDAEIILVNTVLSNLLSSVTRAQEGTTAAAHIGDSLVENRWTAGMYNEHVADNVRHITGGYGIRFVHSTDTITRLGSAVGLVAAISPGFNNFDSIMPWAGMRRCNLANDLSVNAYYGDAGYVETGANGQCMVEVPAFYYSRVQVTSDTHEIYISPSPLAGYRLHPWFYGASGLPLSKNYIATFEGSIYDKSALAYLLTDQQVADFTAATGDLLCSITGAKPCSGLTQNLTLPNSRILATNRGVGWQQQHFNAVSAIQMLFQIEYAGLNSQVLIGQGVVNKADDGATNLSNVTGATTSLGNKSGRAVGTDGLVSISYRGIENFWGNIWKWVDGINIQNTKAFISKVNGNFASDVFTGNYIESMTLVNANGYMSKAGLNNEFDHGFLPAEALGTSASKYADYLYQNGVGSFVGFLGGDWSFGANAGAFFWSLNTDSSYRARGIGARLCA